MLKDIVLKLHAAKKLGKDTGVKAIAYDTAGNYLVQYKQNSTVAYSKEMVESDGDKFVYELINNGNLRDYEIKELYDDKTRQVATDEPVQE